MCLYPNIIKNKKYQINKKNKGIIPFCNDERTKYVAVGCGKCIECVKKKGRDWKIRLHEEIKTNNKASFVTLTFSNESLENLKTKYNIYDNNEIATKAVRLFLERWRKTHKTSVKHWLTTELGHKNTERIHLHGIIFSKEEEQIKKHWQYGWVYIGQYVNEKTINYIVKYVTKIDIKHKEYTPIILCSKGIGSNYTNSRESQQNLYNGKDTKEFYKFRNGLKAALPIYYRNKLYDEETREKLWINKLDEETRYVLGTKIYVKYSDKQYFEALEYARRINTSLGYKEIEWNKKYYKKMLEKLK